MEQELPTWFNHVKPNFENYLNAGDVSQVVVIRNKSSVHVTLTPEALNKSEHQSIKSNG